MKLIVLCDNNTFIDNYLLGEPALSFYIENENDKILFDLGYSDVFKQNAMTLNINIADVNKIVFSHGHNDHTRGLKFINPNKNTKVYFSPTCFDSKFSKTGNISSPYSKDELEKIYELKECESVTQISPNLYFLGTIPRSNNFEKLNENLFAENNETKFVDPFKDDSALVFNSINSISIITGCSHSGICNIITYAKEIFKKPVNLIIGGFHLLENNTQSQKTIEFLKNENIKTVYPCHCTSLDNKCAMKSAGINIFEVGSGLTLEIK